MFDQCKAEYKAMIARIESVIKDKWPETLSDDSAVWQWLDEQKPAMRQKLAGLTQELNAAWQNGLMAEMKKLTLEWGKLQLEIFKGYAAYLREA